MKPTAILLLHCPDQTGIITEVTKFITDNQGNPIANGDAELTCLVENGELLAFFSGDPKNEDLYGSDKCHAFMGKALAVVRANKEATVSVTVYGENLASGNAKTIAK